MDILRMENIGFRYDGNSQTILKDISFNVKKGDFIVVMGDSGSGKSTLLRLMKKELVPNGEMTGSIYFNQRLLSDLSDEEAAAKIGYVMQDPEAQIVTDKVWSELAFGLENLGLPREVIRSRIGEMANYFGIHHWYHKNISELSGGQKQLLNLAAVLVMQPEIVILDEPTAQLDPIASLDFLRTINRINKELNTTIIIAEHDLEEVFGMADQLLLLRKEKRSIIGTPFELIETLLSSEKGEENLPSIIRLHHLLELNSPYPLTISEGIRETNAFFEGKELAKLSTEIKKEIEVERKIAVSLKHVSFKYSRLDVDILNDVSLTINQGEIFTILGGNGSGKSTLIKVMSGLVAPYQGKIKLNGKKIKNKGKEYGHEIAYLPQQPVSMFIKETVKDDYYSFLKVMKQNDIEEKITKVVKLLEIEQLIEQHPYDLSGGELQLVALGKILLLEPTILFLDEPTKGIDTKNKQKIAGILKELAKNGKTIIVVTHDISFSATISDRCGLFFDKQMISISDPETFFSNNYFYTTPINKILKNYFPKIITFDQAKEQWRSLQKGSEINE